MFSGEWKDVRSRTQKQLDHERELPQQQEMFSQSEFAQYVNPHPRMPFYPDEELELIIQDPRTDEEIESDRLEAELAAISPMFPEKSDLYGGASSIGHELFAEGIEIDEQEDIAAAELGAEPPKIDLYLELVQLCEEQAETLWITPTYGERYTAQIATTVLLAKEAGLTNEEIQSAVRIGVARGNERKQKFLESKS